MAYLILRSQPDAEEVLIDTMVTAWRRIESLRDDRALRTWLLRIATRHALSRRRRPTIPTTTLLPDLEVAARSSESPTIDRVALLDALGELPPRTRAAVVLHYFADLTVPDVAAALGRSENTVKTQLRTAFDRLRILLG